MTISLASTDFKASALLTFTTNYPSSRTEKECFGNKNASLAFE